ncbi:MAG: U32 family peptidase [Clostridia bacterium]|nr:U32 family peptidase [Clostridia bacterium]
MEILSPAGNPQSLFAAVRTGADAVYLGLKDFSARRNADNFSESELKEAIRYCHIRGVKVYVAINTMIKEAELAAAVDAAKSAYNFGADAFIVSDIGLISVLGKLLPGAALHASTQMTVHSPAALKALKALGIKRVVLAREMSKKEIAGFALEAKKEGIEVEVFVHGALCMSVSGQCLLSSVLGGRSGNRGLCAGPCRLEFSAEGTGRHDLSLKDLSLIDELNELKNMGVTSAKIEGRMKRPEYVAAATAACRAALDGKSDPALIEALKSVFSRSGFTDGYYNGKLGGDMFGIRTKEDVLNAEGAFSYIHTLYRAERQSVPVNINATVKAGESATLCLKDDRGNKVTVKGPLPEAAKVKSTTADDLRAALSKLGGTPYFANETDIALEGGVYIGLAAINAMRREATEKLDALRAYDNNAADAVYVNKKPQKRTAKKQPRIYARFSGESRVPDDLSGIDAVILPFECDFSSLPKGVLKIADLPRYITDEVAVTKRLYELKSAGVSAAYCGNLAAVTLAKNAGFKVIAANGLNCANSESIDTIAQLGADEITLSAEVNLPKAKYLSGKADTGIFAYGRLPLMLTRNCPVRNVKTCAKCKGTGSLKDRKGARFPVVCRGGYSEVLNSTPICLADKKEDTGYFDFLLLYFTDEDKKTARTVIDGYISGRGEIKDFTRGLYYKNVI